MPIDYNVFSLRLLWRVVTGSKHLIQTLVSSPKLR